VPKNLNNTVEYQVNLEYALVWSKNVPSVQLFKLVGGRDVEAWARRLGMTTPIIPDQALALGASCTRIDELTRAFSAFARNGSLSDPVYVRRVRDRAGNLLEDSTAVSDPMSSPSERLDRMVALGGQARERRDSAAYGVADLAALAPRGDQGSRASAAQLGPSRGRQDRHLQRHHGHLVCRLHLALDDDSMDRRRSPRTSARLQRCRLHAERSHDGALSLRGDRRLSR
jgi:hypothetical protein